MKSKNLITFIMKCAVYVVGFIALITSVNYFVDASSTIRPMHTQMAKLALEGNIVATPQNYNERAYQVCIVEQMTDIPNAVVIGSSRGMFLGKEITGIEDLYNNCVSGACLEDDYALLGLYYNKFGTVPSHVIIETGPWVLYENNPEARWKENGEYCDSAKDFYFVVNNTELTNDSSAENPYISISYFQYNIKQLLRNGTKILNKTEEARVSTNENEAADYPDGSIRYDEKLERESAERLEGVQNTSGAFTYENVNLMTEIGPNKRASFEALVDYLISQGCEVEIYMQPFSVTQCKYSFDEGENESFSMVEEYLISLCQDRGIKLRGSYDSRNFGLTDERFIDSMHLDKIGTNTVWNY